MQCPEQCSECCRHGQVIVLIDKEITAYPKSDRRRVRIGKFRIPALALAKSGNCIYLENGRCSIYETRPRVCRALDPGSWACNDIKRKAAQVQKDRSKKVFSCENLERL